MKAIPNEVRKIIVDAKNRGAKVSDIAMWTGVSQKTIYNIYNLYKKTSSVEPRPQPGRKSKLSEQQLVDIKQEIITNNDITLEELIDKLNLPIKKSRLSKIIIDMGFSYIKKSSPKKISNVPMLSKVEIIGKKIKKN